MNKKYEVIAEKITLWISNSSYGPGDRLPSIRVLSARMDASITTVVTALRLLESRGLVHGRDRAGYFVTQSGAETGLDPADTSSDSPGLRKQRESRDHLKLTLRHDQAILLSSTTPVESYLPTRQIQKSLLRASRRALDSLSYSFPGDALYLRAIEQRMTKLGIKSASSEIIATGGAQEALALALRAVTREGDTVAVFVPSSPGILQSISALNLNIEEIPCDSDGRPNLNIMERALANPAIKALCLSANVSNPTGYTMTDQDKIQMLRIANGKGIPVIEDDVFGDLHWDANRPLPLKAFDEMNSVIYCSSFSKTISPGLRSGWILPGKFYAQVSDEKYSFNFSSPAVTQMAVADYLQSRAHDLYLRKVRSIYQNNLSRLREFVMSEFPEGTTCSDPNGGFTLWVRLPGNIDTTKLYPVAQEAGFCYAPGQLFSMRGEFSNCLRISGVRPIDDEFERGMAFLASTFARTM
ncbi:PLP-dependent aminotransferase family protein [Marinobacter sp. CHS3-4]|uniref:aminotransferase-like domain-containing protein n=1 Tax=Marinobacter sp. CHS3-4 TaxID=3045174 RepID=UPI0024B52340|nr:PLP-dependent aminotransferase family protein [Marinobacter sp. CHS3-4]MDI9245366.1 PLP-dependent aminotransferase family protein [Marinobacter sp. CHS3-4]